MLGGSDGGNRREVYYYTISSNTWTYHRWVGEGGVEVTPGGPGTILPSQLLWTGQLDIACSIVTQKDGAR